MSKAHFYGGGWLGLSSTETRRISAAIGSRVEILPGILAGLTGPLEDHVRSGLGQSSIIA